MQSVDLIVHNAGQLVTCASDAGKPKRLDKMRDVGLIENGALAIHDGKIAAAGKTEEILRLFAADSMLDAGGRVVCPAFVDPHTHVVFAGHRLDEFELKIAGADYLEILESGGGIISTVRQTRAASLETLVEESRRRLDRMLAHGTATAEIKTGYGLETETELKMLGAIFKLNKTHAVEIVPTLLAAHAVPPEFKGREDEYVEIVCNETLKFALKLYFLEVIDFDEEQLKAAVTSGESAGGAAAGRSESELISIRNDNPFFMDVFCEKNAFNPEQSRKVLEAGKRCGMKLKAHVDEFTNLGAARLAIELGATSIDHLDATSDDEIKLLAASETVGIVTPTVNFNFGATHFADARGMIDAGCAVALSTDYNPGSAPCPSQMTAMAIACRYQKLSPAEALNAVTLNAAFGLGLGHRVGSLEAGKQADFLILDALDFREIAYEFGGNAVEKVFKNGKIAHEN